MRLLNLMMRPWCSRLAGVEVAGRDEQGDHLALEVFEAVEVVGAEADALQ